ncbi:hypothetical protein MRB53_030293 [Persea americana]|uniref:Uncharacterized protein n=1 Tax=Persea americana TaxID=3435 RepID=A0ACC2KLB7_PERAE|nr:hypothetical protein MRB53_030293 [Persea americana]
MQQSETEQTKAPSFHLAREDNLDSDYFTAVHRSSPVGDHCATPHVVGDREEQAETTVPKLLVAKFLNKTQEEEDKIQLGQFQLSSKVESFMGREIA